MEEVSAMASEHKELQTSNQNLPADERGRDLTIFVPATDIYEDKDSLVVLVDMPGVDEKSVEIHVEHNILTIGATVQSEDFAGHQETYREYETGRFERQFTLSDEVEFSKIEATVRDGVLRIVLPKAEAARPRKIPVKAG